MLTLRVAILVLLPQFLSPIASAQIIATAPAGFKLDGQVEEWDPDAAVVLGDIRSSDAIWPAQTKQGFVIAGSVSFPSANLAKTHAELAQKAHIEVWLQAADAIELPPINFAGDETLTEKDCAYQWISGELCLQWLREQPAYREKLRGLFTRMWRAAPGGVEEGYATEAFNSLTPRQQRTLKLLKPSGLPVAAFRKPLSLYSSISFSFEVLIPWEALPPSSHLSLDRIKLAVSLVDGQIVRSLLRSDSPPDKDQPPRLISLPIEPPVAAQFTPCEYSLAGDRGEPAYYFMDQRHQVRTAFLLENGSAYFGAKEFGQDTLSPNVVEVNRSVQTLRPGEYLCSNPLTFRNPRLITRSRYGLDPNAFVPASTPTGWQPTKPALLPIRTLANGTRLIEDGPKWTFQKQTYTHCGGCPWGSMDIYALIPSGKLALALSLSARVTWEDLDDYDIELSPDWRTVTEFRLEGDVWTSNAFCLRGLIYKACGEEGHAAPPPHRALPAAN